MTECSRPASAVHAAGAVGSNSAPVNYYYPMIITSVRSKSTNERFLKIEERGRKEYLPLGIASLCVDKRISGFRVKCTDCREVFPVRDLNELGFCEPCACVGIED